jgi:hypothetical protein
MKFLMSVIAAMVVTAYTPIAQAQMLESPMADSTQRIGVVLFDLECDSMEAEALRILTDVMRGELVKSEKYQLIDRAHVQMVLEEQSFQLGQTVDDATKVEMGQIIGAEQVITGRIGYLGKIQVITLQLIDVGTGRVERLEATDFVGAVEHMRRPVRAATQRLIGIGGFLDLGGGFIHIESRPEGAVVYIDGLYEGVTPIEAIVDSTGTFFVKITHEGYQDWSRQIYVDAGETSFLEPSMVSLTPSDIQIESTPPGANVYIYGRFQGVTPLKARVDSAGVYELEMTRDGYHEWNERVHVRIGEDLNVTAPLVPVEIIKVVSNPVGATIYIDGGLVGSAPVSIPVGQPGNYTIRAIQDDYVDWEAPVVVRSGESPQVRALLAPIQMPSLYVSTGRSSLWSFMLPYTIGAGEALIYSLGITSDRPYIGAFLVGAPLTYYGMLRYTHERDISRARASMIISSGLWGTAWGVMSGVAVRPEGQLWGSKESRGAAALAVVASASAIAASTYYTEHVEISSQRVALINAGGFLGTVMGVGFPYLFDASDPRVYFASLVAGGIGGALYSVYATQGFDRPAGEESEDDDGKLDETSMLDDWKFLTPFVAESRHQRDIRAGLPMFGDKSPSPIFGMTLFEHRF